MFNDSTILITGGTGSFGKKCAEILLRDYKPKKLIIFSRDELKQYEMAQKFSPKKYPCMRYFIGDVRDRARLDQAFRGGDYIIHAAALKQVPTAEYNPFECIRTNIMGAENVINAAADAGVKKVVALSTDKACAPVNLYGASKLCQDKLFIAANNFHGARTSYSIVRYGNVIGSRGSVIPLFLKQRESNQPLTITDRRMTRFWLTLEEAVKMVLTSFSMDIRGILVPKIPSMRITDLAEAIAPGLPIKEIGIRPGEKLHETMISEADSRSTYDRGNYYAIMPEILGGNHQGKTLADNFSYNSRDNTEWISVDDMRRIIKGAGQMAV